MHNLKDIRKNIDIFKKKISSRNDKIDFDKLILLDKKNRELIQKKENFERDKKILSKSKDKKNFEQSKILTKHINDLTKEQESLQDNINILLHNIPNIPSVDVPAVPKATVTS